MAVAVAERLQVRIHAGEAIHKLAVFLASLSHTLRFRRHRNCQHVKGLPILGGQFPVSPSAVREYKTQEFAFLRWRLAAWWASRSRMMRACSVRISAALLSKK